jgi:hypothetical protein
MLHGPMGIGLAHCVSRRGSLTDPVTPKPSNAVFVFVAPCEADVRHNIERLMNMAVQSGLTMPAEVVEVFRGVSGAHKIFYFRYGGRVPRRGRIDQEIAARQFAQPRWPSPAKSECHPGCQKDQKRLKTSATGASCWRGGWRAERRDDDGPRRAASRLRMRQVYGSGPSIGGGMCPLHRERQTSVNARKFYPHFGKIQPMRVSCHRYTSFR